MQGFPERLRPKLTGRTTHHVQQLTVKVKGHTLCGQVSQDLGLLAQLGKSVTRGLTSTHTTGTPDMTMDLSNGTMITNDVTDQPLKRLHVLDICDRAIKRLLTVAHILAHTNDVLLSKKVSPDGLTRMAQHRIRMSEQILIPFHRGAPLVQLARSV